MPALAAGATPMGQLQTLTIGIADEVDRLTEELGVVPGCPFGNLAVELSTIDGAVRERLERLFESQRKCCASCSTARSRPASSPMRPTPWMRRAPCTPTSRASCS